MRKLQVVVVPFHLRKGQLVPAGHEPATCPEGGIQRASAMANRYAGVGVYGIWVDDVTYDACDLHEISRIGQVPDIEAIAAAA